MDSKAALMAIGQALLNQYEIRAWRRIMESSTLPLEARVSLSGALSEIKVLVLRSFELEIQEKFAKNANNR